MQENNVSVDFDVIMDELLADEAEFEQDTVILFGLSSIPN